MLPLIAALAASGAGGLDVPFPLASALQDAVESARRFDVAPVADSAFEPQLKLVSGVVGYLSAFQALDGSIVDPYRLVEVQYATPCFAFAAATDYLQGNGHSSFPIEAAAADSARQQLLQTAVRALTASLEQLSTGVCASWEYDPPQRRPGVCHFFTLPAMLAFEALRDVEGLGGPRGGAGADAEVRRQWARAIRRVRPTRAYCKLEGEEGGRARREAASEAGHADGGGASHPEGSYPEESRSSDESHSSEEREPDTQGDEGQRVCAATYTRGGGWMRGNWGAVALAGEWARRRVLLELELDAGTPPNSSAGSAAQAFRSGGAWQRWFDAELSGQVSRMDGNGM
jgi:hypothetical protein